MKQDYEQDVRLVSNEVTRISKLEHEAATKLTENEDKNSQLMMEVDEAVERQVFSRPIHVRCGDALLLYALHKLQLTCNYR